MKKTLSRKMPVTDRPLTEYGDVIDTLVDGIKNGTNVLPKLPDDMTKNSSPETAFRLALSIAGERDEAPVRARRIRNEVLNGSKRSFKKCGSEHFTDHFEAQAIDHYRSKFEVAFTAIERGEVDRRVLLDAIEAAFAIGTFVPPSSDMRERLKSRASRAIAKKDRPKAESPFTKWIKRSIVLDAVE
jgi:hypothetical protein